MLQGQSKNCWATPQGESQRKRKMHKLFYLCCKAHENIRGFITGKQHISRVALF